MNLPTWLTPWRRKSVTTSLDLFRELFGGRVSKSGASVNWKTALDVTTVLACARVIGEGVAQVPLKLLRDSADGRTKLPATDHPLYPILYRRANYWQTSFEFRETIMLHLVLTGNAFVFKNVVGGRITELIPFEPQHVTVYRATGGELTYRVMMPEASSGGVDATGATKLFPAESIWHLRGPSWCGWLGLEPVFHAREAIGLAMATEESQSQFHKNGAQTTGVYSVEGALNEAQFKALRDWIEKYQAGKENAGRPFILDRAAKWTAQQMSGVDAQHLETRRYQVEEICRALRVMPIMVGYSDKASTYASAEQMFLAHVVHTLAPWYERIEQSIDVNLLTDADAKAGIYANFTEEGLLRGSLKDTKDAILGYVNGGILTPNEGRALLDRNPDPDPASDELRIPANIVGETPPPTDTTPVLPAGG
jgi:HK97 family phage portal protein